MVWRAGWLTMTPKSYVLCNTSCYIGHLTIYFRFLQLHQVCYIYFFFIKILSKNIAHWEVLLAFMQAAHLTCFWHNREQVSRVLVEVNVLKFKKTHTLNIHSVFFFLFYYLNLLKSWLHKTCMNNRKTEIQHDSDEQHGIQIECSQTESVFLYIYSFIFSVSFRRKISYETSQIEDWTWLASSPKVRYYLQSLASCY